MARYGNRPPGEVLRAHPIGSTSARTRTGELGPSIERDQPRRANELGALDARDSLVPLVAELAAATGARRTRARRGAAVSSRTRDGGSNRRRRQPGGGAVGRAAIARQRRACEGWVPRFARPAP